MSNPYAPPSPDRPTGREGAGRPAEVRGSAGDTAVGGDASGSEPRTGGRDPEGENGPGQSAGGTGGVPRSGTDRVPGKSATGPDGTPHADRVPRSHPTPLPGRGASGQPGRPFSPGPAGPHTDRPGEPGGDQQDPPDPEAVLATARLARQFGVWLVAAVLVSTFALPWRLAAIAFVIGALIWGLRVLRASSRAKVGGGMGPMVIVGLVMAGLLGISSLGSAALWPAESAREACLGTAVTASARVICERDYQQQVTDLTEQMLGSTSATDGS